MMFRSRLRGIVVLAVLAVVVGLGFSPADRAEIPSSTGVNPRLDRFFTAGSFTGGLGVNVHFLGGHERDLEQITAIGFRVVRTDLLWADIETERGKYDWRASDQFVRQSTDNHLTPLFILAYSNPIYAPRVAGHPLTDSLAYAAPQSGAARAAFMAFVRAAVRRYGERVIWEIWNEPDHNFGEPVDLKSFIGFSLEACRQMRGVAPNASVIAPALSGFVWWFIRDFVAADTGHCIDALSVHPYRDEAPESVLEDWARARSMLPKCDPQSRCLALINSEWGYSVTGGAWTAKRQADYVVRLRLLDVMAGIPLSIIYDWQNDGPNPDDKEANFGLLTYNGQRKRAYDALATMARDLRGSVYLGRVATERKTDFLLAFAADGKVPQLVGWSASDQDNDLSVDETVCVGTPGGGVLRSTSGSCGPDAKPITMQGHTKLQATPRIVGAENASEATSIRLRPGRGTDE